MKDLKMTNLKMTNLKYILDESIDKKEYIFFAMVYKPVKKIATNGQSYINLYLRDNKNSINAKKWNISSNDEEKLKHGNVLKIFGKTNFYNGVIQFIIHSLEVVFDEKIINLILPSSPNSIENMWKEFQYFLNEIKDEDYKKVISTIFDDKNKKKFKETRGGISMHHDVFGGLLWHTLTILKSAEKIYEIYSKEIYIDKCLLYSGIIFHDIGKIYEIGDFLNESYSNQGMLLGHISIGASLIFKVGKDLKINEEKIYKLQHLILSSHGKLENGSPVEPKMIESIILSHLDNLDAKLNSIFKAINNTQENEKWTNKISTLNGHKIYIPKKN